MEKVRASINTVKPLPLLLRVVATAGWIGTWAWAETATAPATLSTSNGAVTTAMLPADAKKGNPTEWLSREQLDALIAAVPPAPEPNSPKDNSDLAAILAAQASRTPEIEKTCKTYQNFSEKLFQDIYGPGLNKENSPLLFKMIRNVLAATATVNGTAKDKNKRLRPYQGHPDVVHALFQVNGFSYPSGHSMASFTLATVLGAIFPDRKQAFLDRAAAIAQSRVDAGVHYPSDIQEGEVLGKATGDAILANAAFQKDLAAVQAELKH